MIKCFNSWQIILTHLI